MVLVAHVASTLNVVVACDAIVILVDVLSSQV